MGLLEVLTIVFIVLKLIGVITWSWWLVCTPLLIAVGIYVLWTILMLLIFIFSEKQVNKALKKRNRKR